MNQSSTAFVGMDVHKDSIEIAIADAKEARLFGRIGGEFVDEVDFPGFVSDLLKGVFDANLEVTLEQTEAYQSLLKAATQSLATIINKIDDTAAFGYLVDSQSDDFSLNSSDEEKDSAGNPKAILTDKAGGPVDLGDNQIKDKIMDAKIQMAREQRAMLRETILMGITRLVVEKGNVKASCVRVLGEGHREHRPGSQDHGLRRYHV